MLCPQLCLFSLLWLSLDVDESSLLHPTAHGFHTGTLKFLEVQHKLGGLCWATGMILWAKIFFDLVCLSFDTTPFSALPHPANGKYRFEHFSRSSAGAVRNFSRPSAPTSLSVVFARRSSGSVSLSVPQASVFLLERQRMIRDI